MARGVHRPKFWGGQEEDIFQKSDRENFFLAPPKIRLAPPPKKNTHCPPKKIAFSTKNAHSPYHNSEFLPKFFFPTVNKAQCG